MTIKKKEIKKIRFPSFLLSLQITKYYKESVTVDLFDLEQKKTAEHKVKT